jgi:hypothetical protein
MKILLGLLLLGVSEDLSILDRGSLVERVKKAYAPVNFKFDGEWLVTSPTGTETWTWSQGKWRCPQSTYKCDDFVPVSFRWFSQGKSWISAGQPGERIGYDFKGSSNASSHRHSAKTGADEEDDGNVGVNFEGKRNAHEVWVWQSSFSPEFKIFVSLRDYLIERLDTGDGTEILEWGARSGKTMALDKVFLDRAGVRILLSKK